MTDSKTDGEKLDPGEISSQAAALAAHLQRSGAHFLPVANPAAVESLADSFVADDEESTGASEAVSGSPAVKPTVDAPPTVVDTNRPASVRPAARVEPVAMFTSADGAYPGEPLDAGERQAALDVINAEVSGCTKCEILSSCRTNTVFGEGSVSPRVAFFGEGPGADEDRSGRPFVGRAGQLLTKMIEACKFKREDVYILNTVKCRPPGNRNPEADEIENCRDYYQRQLAVLRPEYVVCLGAVSAQELLKSKLSVGRLRGKLHQYFESKVLVTYHPAYLLRNPAAKKAAWADLQLMLRDAGIQI